jgi:hypothetical protein
MKPIGTIEGDKPAFCWSFVWGKIGWELLNV